MWIKLLGGGMVFASSAFCGQHMAHRLLVRERSLRGFLTAFSLLESEIGYSEERLGDAFLRVGHMCGMRVFEDAAQTLSELGAKKSWQEALVRYQGELGLERADTEVLKLFANQLGQIDREQQLRQLRRITALTEQQCAEAAKMREDRAKLYRSMGILGGIFLTLILL